jgi:arachidonate 15-lipoxygenase
MQIPTLPSADRDAEARRRRLEEARRALTWAHDRPDGVGTAAAVPRGDGYPASVLAEVATATVAVQANRAARRLERGLHRAPEQTTPAVAASLYATIDRPLLAQAAADPRRAADSFAWQRQAGVNPYALQRLASLPRGWPASLVRDHCGRSAAGEARAGRLYLCDYTAQASLRPGDGRVLPPTSVLCWADDDGRLRVLGIRCPELVTPAEGLRFALAMATARAADGNHAELFWHLGRAHFLLEAVAVAARRQLDALHPLSVLLAPHLEGTLAINGAARDQLVVPGGQIDVLLGPALPDAMTWVRQGAQSFDPATARPDRWLADRGLLDAPLQLPLRDDGLRVFTALLDWVTAYVDIAYDSDDAVATDDELQGFATELRADDGGRLAAVGELATREQVAQLFASVLWTATGHHAIVNYTQYDLLGDAQYTPGASWGQVPTVPPGDADAAWASVLPPPTVAAEQLDFYYQQSRIRVNTLGHYGPRQFADPRLLPALNRFARALADAESAIRAADAQRFEPFPYLLPSRIAASIHI